MTYTEANELLAEGATVILPEDGWSSGAAWCSGCRAMLGPHGLLVERQGGEWHYLYRMPATGYEVEA